MRTPLYPLKRRADFLRVAALRRKWAMPGLVLQVAPNPLDDAVRPRIGFTASRKVGGAVQRNRARRRLREAVRAVLAAHAKPGLDYVVIAREQTVTRPWPDLLIDMEVAMRRLKSWQDPA
ncbi:MAG: ribonuclease P protein component [Elstera sp.]|jgi:ribonuclease P protein component|uniref:ribonuclease P protein component n=1 Tax=Elstera sp. TaxID=1916664 RepID=UPI0037C1830D